MPTAEEAKKHNIDKMGEPLGAQFSALWQEVAQLHMNWAEYVELFGTKPQRIELLNRAAPYFFRMIQDRLWETAVLHLARLTDPPKSMGQQDKQNLTIQNLPELINDAMTKAEVISLNEIALKETEFCRDWRNRYIAHRDLNLALDQPTTPLAEGSRKQVSVALKVIANVMNAVQIRYLGGETRYDLAARHNGSVTLLYLLDEGLRAKGAREQKILKGEFSEEDHATRDL
jgi:hypothetical protein